MRYERTKLSYNSPEKEEVKSIVEQYRKAREQGKDASLTRPSPTGTAIGWLTG